VPSLSSRSNTIESSDALSNYTGSAQATPGTSPAVSQLPSGFPAYASSEMWREGSGTGTHTPGGYFGPTQPLDIVLDSEHLVMRGQGGDTSPAYLSGRIELNLHESTNIREITMTLQGKAKVSFTESQWVAPRRLVLIVEPGGITITPTRSCTTTGPSSKGTSGTPIRSRRATTPSPSRS
jgi:hypothetical protein